MPKANPKSSSHYETLQIATNASEGEIKAAYRKLALKLHPDKNKAQSSSEESFLVIQRAWECLRDNDLRKEYDEERRRMYQQSKLKMEAACSLRMSEMEQGVDEETDGIVFYYTCRCGDQIDLWPEDIPHSKATIITECPGCSFCYSVENDVCQLNNES
mmetsp:Transcript_347/g.512  ORF Transcript_347/g.512 Transcript_347/m.512 type:complete len:159 (+) Transcript_347:163-639(+)|eukprot:CAMPEP_0202464030 /NCGR_PEP_ID=MMETSP1360-20130828/60491_1 /ASSEMBLY_ACC=CAM_ASM_000848 /TAXON_ID=515479 /ORGANISM="Licmophora paradoxa, Strain CCMP2313" /LENGTH=158 /DNA_ID=CAMNT_0049087155 /DNA_START=160 /DNA_END=636 /DNA_ORIENTATION=-